MFQAIHREENFEIFFALQLGPSNIPRHISEFNPNKQGIGEKSPTFVQNNFTP